MELYRKMIHWNTHSVGVYISERRKQREKDKKDRQRETWRDRERQTLSSNCFMKVSIYGNDSFK